MAPQTDKAIPQKAADHPASTPPKSGESAQDALQRQANDLRHEAPKVTDAKPKTHEIDPVKVAESLKLSIKPEDLKILGKEHDIQESRNLLLAQIKKPGTDAKTLQASQDNFKKAIHDGIATSADLQKGASGSRPIDRITDSLATTERHQAALEKELKLNSANQPNYLKGILAKDPASLSANEKDYVDTLTMKETLRYAKESAAVTNAAFGSAVAKGLIGDLSHRDASGMATPSNAEVAEAFTKMGIAQRLNGESREPGDFKDDYTKIVAKYADQLSVSGRTTLDDINRASTEWHKNPAGAESLLRSANYTVDAINLPQIQQQIDANKSNPELTEKLTNVLKIANSARTEYASFLYENGRLGEAQAKLTQAMTETPAQAASDPSFAKLLENTGTKANAQESSIDTYQQQFRDNLQNRDWDKADVAAKHLQDATNDRIKQQEQGKAVLDQQQTQLKEKLATAQTQAEKDSITTQIGALQAKGAEFDTQKKLDSTNLAYLSYQQGFLHMSEKNMAQANADFKKVGELDPALAKSLNDSPPNDLPKLDDLVKQTKEPSWWQSHWRTVAGVGIGIAATIAVVATGGAALPAVAIVLAGGGLYAGAGATAGETEGKQLAVNFGVGCATTAVSVLLKGVPMWTGAKAATSVAVGAGGAEATSLATTALANEGLSETAKLTAQEVAKAGLTNTAEVTTTEAVKQVAASETVKQAVTAEAGNNIATTATGWGNFVAGARTAGGNVGQWGVNTGKELISFPLKQTAAQAGFAATGLGFYEGAYKMGVQGESAKQVFGHLGKDAVVAFAATKGVSAIGVTTPYLGALNSFVVNSGMGLTTTAGGYAFAAAPEVQKYYSSQQTFDQAVQNTFTNGAATSMAFGMTNHAMDKYLTADRLFPAASLSTSALFLNAGRSALPFAGQEAVGDGIAAATNKPLDATNDEQARKITSAYVTANDFNDRVPLLQTPPSSPDAPNAPDLKFDPNLLNQ